jgi:hypothetical protein
VSCRDSNKSNYRFLNIHQLLTYDHQRPEEKYALRNHRNENELISEYTEMS